jgi:hypothetical protein
MEKLSHCITLSARRIKKIKMGGRKPYIFELSNEIRWKIKQMSKPEFRIRPISIVNRVKQL